MLFQDVNGRLPDAKDAADYWVEVNEPSFPVMADEEALTLEATPYPGNTLPGKCILTPEMEMLDCTSGENEDDWAFEQIIEDAAE